MFAAAQHLSGMVLNKMYGLSFFFCLFLDCLLIPCDWDGKSTCSDPPHLAPCPGPSPRGPALGWKVWLVPWLSLGLCSTQASAKHAGAP